MLAIPKRECDPGSPYWTEISAALRIREHIKEFQTPQAVLAYMRQPKVQQRLMAMRESWRAELVRRAEKRVSDLNDTGPFPQHYEHYESRLI